MLDFPNITQDMHVTFRRFYNEKAKNTPIYFTFCLMVVIFLAGGFVIYKAPTWFGFVGTQAPGWYGVLIFAWIPISFFGGAKIGMRLYHWMFRDSLLYEIRNKIDESELTSEEKETLKNYTVYYIDTATFRLRDM